MKLKKLWSNNSNVNKVVLYNFDFNFSELNNIIYLYYKKYSNVIYNSSNNHEKLKFNLCKTESNSTFGIFEIYFDYLDFKNYSEFNINLASESITNHFAIINLKSDYLTFFNGILGLLDDCHQYFLNNNHEPLFLMDVLISKKILSQLYKINTYQLSDNQLFHSIIFSPSESSENILQQDKSLYKIISNIRKFLEIRAKKQKQYTFVCGTLLYFTMNNKLDTQNFIYYCNKHINSNISFIHG